MKTSHNKEKKGRMLKKTNETLEERVHRHLNDINSKITDDDIRNVRTEMEIRSQGPVKSARNAPENRKGRRSGKQKKQDKPGPAKQITPWDILDED